jgi:XTP/dITP diphosphohydrolase
VKILIATKNKGKYGEIAGFLAGVPGLEVVFLGDYEVEDEDFVEDGETHEENAYKKASYYFDKLVREIGHDFDYVVGEDSGIYVEALADELGVETRRWGAGHDATDEEWLEYFMKEMEVRTGLVANGGSEAGRGAKFVCNACLVGPGSSGVGIGELLREHFEGETPGVIVGEIASEVLPGLPLSSVFLADGAEEVYSMLGREKKNEISHRGQAVAKLKEYLTLLS